MTKTSYQINGLFEPAMHVVFGGTLYFIHNVSWENFPLKKMTYTDHNTLRIDFEPSENLPAYLRDGCEHFLEVSPCKDFSMVVREIADFDNRARAYYLIIDTANTVKNDSKYYFCMRKYVCHNYQDKLGDIPYRANEKDPPEKRFVRENGGVLSGDSERILYQHDDK